MPAPPPRSFAAPLPLPPCSAAPAARGPPSHPVQARAAVEDVGCRVAVDDIVEGIAGAVARAGTGEDQHLDIGPQHMADEAEDRVAALVGELGYRIAQVIDVEAVVTRPAFQPVRPRGAV